MKHKFETIIACAMLGLWSFLSPFVFCYSYLGIGGAVYVAGNGSFNAENAFDLIVSFIMLAVFFISYITAAVYLSKRLYVYRRWMAVIPVLASLLIVVLSVFFLWRYYQWE